MSKLFVLTFNVEFILLFILNGVIELCKQYYEDEKDEEVPIF